MPGDSVYIQKKIYVEMSEWRSKKENKVTNRSKQLGTLYSTRPRFGIECHASYTSRYFVATVIMIIYLAVVVPKEELGLSDGLRHQTG